MPKKKIRKDQYRQDPNMFIHVDSAERTDDWWSEYMSDLDSFNYKKLEKTDEGYLVGRAVATTVGVFPYMEDGETIYELRAGKEVFNPESVQSLSDVPLTDDHPAVLVDAVNVKEYQIGFVSDCVDTDTVNGFISVPVTIQDAEVVDKVVNKKKRGLSCGYTCDIVEKEGVWGGIYYNRVQTNIRYNHLAIVDRGRAGDDAVLKMDTCLTNGKNDSLKINEKKHKGGLTMSKIKLDGVSYEAEDRVIEHFDAMSKKVEKFSTKLDEAQNEITKKDAEIEAEKAKVSILETEKEALKVELDGSISKDKLDSYVAEKAKLDGAIKHFEVEVTDSMSALDKKVAVIKKAKSMDKADWFENEVAVSSVFDMILGDVEKQDETQKTNKDSIADTMKPREDKKEVVVDKVAEAKMKADKADRDAWRNK